MIENSEPLSCENEAGAIAVAMTVVPCEGATSVVPYAPVSCQTALRDVLIRHVDRPALGNTAEGFERFSGDDMFTLHPRLKAAHDGEGALEKATVVSNERVACWMRQSKLGFELRDRQLSAAAGGTLMYCARPGQGLLSWTRLAVRTPGELGVPAYSASPSEAVRTVNHGPSISGPRSQPPDAITGVLSPAQGIGTKILYGIPVPLDPAQFARGLNAQCGVFRGWIAEIVYMGTEGSTWNG
jgi:hypothetical protein